MNISQNETAYLFCITLIVEFFGAAFVRAFMWLEFEMNISDVLVQVRRAGKTLAATGHLAFQDRGVTTKKALNLHTSIG